MIEKYIRDNIRRLTPYSSARSEFTGEASIFLDANENPYDNGFNRYPDPLQRELKQLVSSGRGIPEECIFIGNGSDEAIDLMYRIFCRPGKDNAICFSPTYGMYGVAAEINDVELRTATLRPDFSLPVEEMLALADNHSKVMFVCSPNNPTGNAFACEDILRLVDGFDGIAVVDEAYIDFSSRPSMTAHIHAHPNMVVLQTLSKAHGMAGLRVGFAFADKEIINVMNAVKYPYNVNAESQRIAIAMLKAGKAAEQTAETLRQRRLLADALAGCACVRRVYPSDANFLLVETDDAKGLYRRLLDKGIVVRDRSSVELCAGCLRITVGTPTQNETLISTLKEDNTHKGKRNDRI